MNEWQRTLLRVWKGGAKRQGYFRPSSIHNEISPRTSQYRTSCSKWAMQLQNPSLDCVAELTQIREIKMSSLESRHWVTCLPMTMLVISPNETTIKQTPSNCPFKQVLYAITQDEDTVCQNMMLCMRTHAAHFFLDCTKHAAIFPTKREREREGGTSAWVFTSLVKNTVTFLN